MEESRKFFHMFATNMLEERVMNAYKEKVALEKQRELIEEEDRAKKQRDKRQKKKFFPMTIPFVSFRQLTQFFSFFSFSFFLFLFLLRLGSKSKRNPLSQRPIQTKSTPTLTNRLMRVKRRRKRRRAR